MKEIDIDLKNCYGIRDLQAKVDLSSSNTIAIYAPNGVMKTSFARTFKDFSQGSETKDLIFPNRVSVREIKRENGNDLGKNDVFVVESYLERFNPDKQTTLLVNKTLKEEFDSIRSTIDNAEDALLKKLKQLSGLPVDNIEKEIKKCFQNREIFDVLSDLKSEIEEPKSSRFGTIVYNKIFNDKVSAFLSTGDFKYQIKEYIDEYNKLLSNTKYLKKEFDHFKAANVQKNLEDNGFFKAHHSINLSDGSKKIEVKDSEELQKIIQEEKESILMDKSLQEKWEKIDGKLNANQDLRSFREVLSDNREILPELEDLGRFAQEIWLSYFIDEKDLAIDLLKKYMSGKDSMEKIIKVAREKKTDWESVVEIFNTRFCVPFKLEIKNKDDTVLKGSAPIIDFIFEDTESSTYIDEGKLLKVLSSGEKRALYLLNIIFEVEARKKSQQETLFIIDDIADSFDYKNKYAIVEYLKEISEQPNFYQIILTHNFDFFRTLESRGVVRYQDCFFSVKTEEKISLEKTECINNPFINDWKNKLSDPKKLIASIPFIRNLIEYTKGNDDDDYKKLTSLLHWKKDSENFLMKDLKEIFERTINGIQFPSNDLLLKVVDRIFEVARGCLSDSEGANLENKIVLSIAIRLSAEKFMISEIDDPTFILGITRNQTAELLKKYKKDYPNEKANINTLEEVNLMTPGVIHINSFMYEPILDMSDQSLRVLYENVNKLEHSTKNSLPANK